jgi:hypothetical protein
VTFNDDVIDIPSKNLKIRVTQRWPFGVLCIMNDKVEYLIDLSPQINIIDYITKFLDDKSSFSMKVWIKSNNKDIFSGMNIRIDSDATVTELIEIIRNHYNRIKHDIRSLNYNNRIYSCRGDYENKKIWDIITDSSQGIYVNFLDIMSEDELINYMKDPDHVTTHLSETKIVSTVETGPMIDIVYYHLNLYIDNIKYILQNVFEKDGVCVKFINNGDNPVIFYIESYLNKFADKLKSIEEFKEIENLPDHLLSTIGFSIEKSNNLYFTIMLALFGDIVYSVYYPSDFVLNETVHKLYKEYLEDAHS